MPQIVTTTYDSTTDSNALTCTLAALPTSASLIAGRQSSIIDNSSNQFVDLQIMGQVMTGTTPVAGTLALYAFSLIKRAASVNTYPLAGATVLGATDAAATFDAEQLQTIAQIWSSANNTTSNRAYPILVRSLAAFFGGTLPMFMGLFFAHSSGVNLHATAANHWLHWQGIKFTST